MKKILQRLKREIRTAFPVILYFFVVFQLLGFTELVLLKAHGIEVSTFLKAAIASLVIGKVVPIVDLWPFINRFSHKPLIYNILWKTFIYMLVAVIFRYLKNLVPLIAEYKSIIAANSHLYDQAIWSYFVLVQIWLLVCLFMLCMIREIGRVVGHDNLRRMMLGSGKVD